MTDTRLRAIEARARALGWKYLAPQTDPGAKGTLAGTSLDLDSDGFGCTFHLTDAGLTAAERLLTAYEPVTGPVVEIGDEDCHNCQLDTGDQACNFPCKELGPGTYRLVPCDDKEDK